jgi:hypothetical protein
VTFELPIVGVPLLECTCWDKDRFGRDHMGEFDIPLEEIFADGETHQQVRVTWPRFPWVALINAAALAKMVSAQVKKKASQEERQRGFRRNPASVFPI